MTAPSLLDELAGVVNLMNDPTKYSDQIGQAAVEFLDAHHAEIADMAKRLEAAERDSKRLDALERMANKPGGVLLHDGSESGRCGIGMRPGAANRTLRQAIDAAAQEGEG